MASSSLYPMLLISLLLLSLSNTLLCSVHHNPKLPQAPSPALVVATPAPAPAPVDTQAPSPVSALAPAEAPTKGICSDAINGPGIFECMDYLQGTDAKRSPSPSCCSALREIAKHDVGCLCLALTSTSNPDDFVPGIQINISRVLSLPYTCTFTLPSPSKCTALLGPPTVAAVPGPSVSQGTSDIASPPLPSESLAAAFSVTIFTIAAGIVVSALSLFA